MSLVTKKIRGVDYEYFEYYMDGKKRSLCLGKKGGKYYEPHIRTILHVYEEKLKKFKDSIPFERLKIEEPCKRCNSKRDLVTVVWEDENGKKVDRLCLGCLCNGLRFWWDIIHLGFLFLNKDVKI